LVLLGACGDVPYDDLLVVGPRGDHRAVAGELDGRDRSGVAAELSPRGERRRIEQEDGVVVGRPHRKRAAVGADLEPVVETRHTRRVELPLG
jgi:hypothetical protein